MDKYVKTSKVFEIAKEYHKDFAKSLADLTSLREVLEDTPAENVKKEEYCINLASDYPSLFECSSCGWSDDDTYTGDTSEYNFCPNCGRKVRKEK